MLDPRRFLDGCQVSIPAARYAVVKAKYVPDTFVAVFRDPPEITVVALQDILTADWVIEAERGWRLLSFRTVLPFELTGFLAVVAQALAEENISIFALSAYSTDHLLVKEDKLALATRTLAKLGCTITDAA